LSIPLFKNDRIGSAEAQLAARYEDYSDFGTTTKPKIALAWRPTKWLMLRGSYSESFKAPDLAFLYTRGSVSFTSNQIFDPRRPDVPSAQIKTLGRGNPNLQPEETETQFAGVVFEIPKGPLKGLSFDVSYFKFDQTNLIVRDGAGFTLTNELILPAGRVVRRALTPAEIAAGISVGTIDFVATDWINANKTVLQGWDFGMSYNRRFDRLGSLRAQVSATYNGDYERTVVSSLGASSIVDQDGRDSFPLWRGNATLTWTKGDYSASVFIRYIGGYPAEFLTGLGTEPDTDDQWTVNPQFSFNAPWKTRVTVGVRNVFNKPPPRYLSSQFGYNNGINPVEPAFAYIRASREF
jgi:outer membrane receptor protein involved in Fe transport